MSLNFNTPVTVSGWLDMHTRKSAKVYADVKNGLAIHPMVKLTDEGIEVLHGAGYTITHAQSGKYVMLALSEDDAINVREALLQSDIDWCASERKLPKNAIGSMVRRIKEELLKEKDSAHAAE